MTTRSTSICDTRLGSLANNHPAATFFALALIISWGLWIPLLATRSTVTKFHILPGGFGPALAAVVLTQLRGKSVSEWLRDGLDWRLDKRWYAIALGLPIVAGVTMGGIFVVATGSFAPNRITRIVSMYPVFLLFMTLIGGGQEEFGWRGIALPVLQERFDALTASGIIGVVWAGWHLPLFVFDVPGYSGRSFGLYAVVVIGFAVLFTWLYNSTNGSILLAMVFHGGINAASSLGGAFVTDPTAASIPVFVAYGIPIWIIAGTLVLRYGRESLSTNAVISCHTDDDFTVTERTGETVSEAD